MNPYIKTSFKWYEYELRKIYGNYLEIRQSRGYTFWVGTMLINCKDNNVSNWNRIK